MHPCLFLKEISRGTESKKLNLDGRELHAKHSYSSTIPQADDIRNKRSMHRLDLKFVVGYILIFAVCTSSEKCGMLHLMECTKELSEAGDGDFDIFNLEQMKEVCETKKKLIDCVSGFISNCMGETQKEFIEATAGGRLKVISEMCTEGTDTYQGYKENFECWEKVNDDMKFCNENFQNSSKVIAADDMENRLKVFHGCCAFEWHRKCLSKVTKAKCSDMAGDFVHQVTTAMGGTIQKQTCSSSYSSCHGLYGVDVDLNQTSMLCSSIFIILLSLIYCLM